MSVLTSAGPTRLRGMHRRHAGGGRAAGGGRGGRGLSPSLPRCPCPLPSPGAGAAVPVAAARRLRQRRGGGGGTASYRHGDRGTHAPPRPRQRGGDSPREVRESRSRFAPGEGHVPLASPPGPHADDLVTLSFPADGQCPQ